MLAVCVPIFGLSEFCAPIFIYSFEELTCPTGGLGTRVLWGPKAGSVGLSDPELLLGPPVYRVRDGMDAASGVPTRPQGRRGTAHRYHSRRLGHGGHLVNGEGDDINSKTTSISISFDKRDLFTFCARIAGARERRRNRTSTWSYLKAMSNSNNMKVFCLSEIDRWECFRFFLVPDTVRGFPKFQDFSILTLLNFY
jgi:hypothetical protein